MIHFLSVFPPYRGGISSFSDSLYRELSKTEEITAYNFSKLYPPFLFPGRTQYNGNDRSSYALPAIHSYNPFIKFGTGNLTASSAEDAVIYSYWHPFFVPSLISSLSTLSNNSTPVYGIFHNISPHERFPFQRSLIQRLIARTSAVILLSEQTKTEYLALQTNKPFLKLYHPIYEQQESKPDFTILRNKYGVRSDEHVVLFFGLVRPYKGLDILIEALNKIDLKEKKIRPLIAGEFYTNKKKALSGVNPDYLDDYIIIDRFVSDNEVAEIFKISDITVLPYHSASQSGILANAINFRVPVIISNLPGLTEHIVHNRHGYILEENSPDCLRNAILQMLGQTNLMACRNHLNALKNHLSWGKFTYELTTFIKV